MSSRVSPKNSLRFMQTLLLTLDFKKKTPKSCLGHPSARKVFSNSLLRFFKLGRLTSQLVLLTRTVRKMIETLLNLAMPFVSGATMEG